MAKGQTLNNKIKSLKKRKGNNFGHKIGSNLVHATDKKLALNNSS